MRGRSTRARSQTLFPKPGYSPYAGNTFPTRPLFGDTHLHTSQSFDAIAFGNFLGPEEAYRFARGEEVISSTGQRARLSRPLDFLVVADHAENMGTMGEIKAGNPALMDDPELKRWNQMLAAGGEQAMNVYYEIMASVGGSGKPLPAALRSEELTRSVWQKNVQAAEENNDPGTFTALIGYEWSSNTGGNNLHRVVVFRDGAEKAEQILPFSSLAERQSRGPLEGASKLRDEDRRQRARHPSQRQSVERPDVPADQSRRRKADHRGVCAHPRKPGAAHGSHPDEGRRGDASIFVARMTSSPTSSGGTTGNLDLSVAKTPEMLEFEYARSALKNGLKLEARAWREPLQIRDDRIDGLPHLARRRRREQLLRQAASSRTERRRALRTRSPSSATRWSWAGKWFRAGMLPSGRRRTRAKPSSTR